MAKRKYFDSPNRNNAGNDASAKVLMEKLREQQPTGRYNRHKSPQVSRTNIMKAGERILQNGTQLTSKHFVTSN